MYSENTDYSTVENYGETVEQQDTTVAAANQMFRKAIRWLVYVAAFLTPLWFLPFTADVVEFNKQVLLIAIAGIGLVIYLVDVIRSGVVKFRPSSFYWPMLGLVSAGALSLIFSVNRVTSLFGTGGSRSFSFISLASLVILFCLAVNTIEDQGKTLRKVLTASLVLAFLFAIFQAFGLFLLGGGLFGSKEFNSVGTFNSLGIIAALALAFFSGTDKNSSRFGVFNIIRYAGLALALFLVVVINRWPIWTVAFVSLIASVAFGSVGDTSSVKSGKMKLFAIPMAVIVLGIFLMLVNFNWTFLKSGLPIEVAPSQRISWGIAGHSLLTRPLGFGAENFVIAYDKLKPASIVNSVFYQLRFSDGASEIINLIVEGGALMILAFLALLWFYGRKLFVEIRSGGGGATFRGGNWATSLGMIAALFFYPFNLTLFTLFFLSLALIVLSDPVSGNEKTVNLESDARYSFVGSVGFIAGLVLVLVAGYFTVNNYLANVYLAKGARNADLKKSVEYFVASANANSQDARSYRLMSQAILTQLANDFKSGPQKDETKENYNTRIQNQIASVVNIAIRATSVDPNDSQNWVNRGVVYQNLISLVGGADQAAVSSFNEVLVRNPKDPSTYFSIGNVYLVLVDNLQRAISGAGATDAATAREKIRESLIKAEDNFQKAITLYNNYGQALYNLATVYDRQGRLPEAIKQFEKLQAANARDPSIVFQLGLLYYRNGQKDNAFRAWQQAVFLFPNYSNARWYLSLIYEERGDLANALNQVQEIQKLNPDNDLVKQRLVQLESGKRTIPPEKLLDKKPLNQ